MCVIYWAIAGY